MQDPRVPPPSVTFTPPNQDAQNPVQGEYGDATAADDDSRWRFSGATIPDDPVARDQARISQCEQRVARAWDAERPRQLLKAIRDGGCSALLAGGPSECVSCRICPSNAAWEYLAGYYRGAKQKLYVCAEKEPSQQQVEDVLTHELTHAYDHCRFGVKFPPVVGWRTQAPWALTCGAEACSEVRALLLAEHWSPQGATLDPGLIAGGFASAAPRAATPAEAAAVQRERIYRRALETTEAYGTCARQGRDCRAVLDAVFNACLADPAPLAASPFAPPPQGFPPMPPEVAAAEQLPATPPPAQLPPPPPVVGTLPPSEGVAAESQEV